MVNYAKLFKGAIALISIGSITLVLLHAHANKEETRPAKEPQASNVASSAAPQIAANKSKYALPPLTPAQVKKLNALTTQPETAAPKPELAPPAPSNAGRCVYNNQTYALGDIVRTEQGWLRCTPTLSFNPDKPTLPQPDRPAWTRVQ